GWSTTIPDVDPNEFLWTKTTFNYSDESSTVAYSVSKMGADGNDGQDGQDGISTEIISIYHLSTSSISVPYYVASYDTNISSHNWTIGKEDLDATNKYGFKLDYIKTTNPSETEPTYTRLNEDPPQIYDTNDASGDYNYIRQLNTFNELTKYGEQEVYKYDGSNLYINASFINTGILTIKNGLDEIFLANVDAGIIQLNSTDYIAGTSNFSDSGSIIHIDTNGLYIKSENFAVDSSGNAYFKGNINALSGTIGSGENSWNIGTSGLYYGISSLADATFIDGMYVGIDGFRNQKTYSYTYDTGTVDVENEVILLDGHIQLKNTIIEHDGIHGDTTYAHSGGLSTGELVLSSGGTMFGSTFSITTNGQVLGTIIKADDYDRIKITGPDSPYKNTLYDDWIVDGTIQISTYDLATKITDIESRLLALEAVG
ncbi:MAG: hypothetical protein WCU80_11415, partial [Paludibacteraceae bacterium]